MRNRGVLLALAACSILAAGAARAADDTPPNVAQTPAARAQAASNAPQTGEADPLPLAQLDLRNHFVLSIRFELWDTDSGETRHRMEQEITVGARERFDVMTKLEQNEWRFTGTTGTPQDGKLPFTLHLVGGYRQRPRSWQERIVHTAQPRRIATDGREVALIEAPGYNIKLALRPATPHFGHRHPPLGTPAPLGPDEAAPSEEVPQAVTATSATAPAK